MLLYCSGGKITDQSKKNRTAHNERFYFQKWTGRLLLGLFPSILADESSQVAAVGSLAAESVAGAAFAAVGDELGDSRGDSLLLFHIIKLVIHFLTPLVGEW